RHSYPQFLPLKFSYLSRALPRSVLLAVVETGGDPLRARSMAPYPRGTVPPPSGIYRVLREQSRSEPRLSLANERHVDCSALSTNLRRLPLLLRESYGSEACFTADSRRGL